MRIFFIKKKTNVQLHGKMSRGLCNEVYCRNSKQRVSCAISANFKNVLCNLLEIVRNKTRVLILALSPWCLLAIFPNCEKNKSQRKYNFIPQIYNIIMFSLLLASTKKNNVMMIRFSCTLFNCTMYNKIIFLLRLNCVLNENIILTTNTKHSQIQNNANTQNLMVAQGCVDLDGEDDVSMT